MGADRAGPRVSPPSAGVRRAGDCQPREGGIGTCPVSPQAPRAVSASPTPPHPGHGKEREGRRARRADAGFSPASRRRNWDSGYRLPGSAPRGPFPPQEAQAPPHARGAHVGFLASTDSLFSLSRVLQTGSPPLAAPLGLHSRGCATPSHAQARGAQHPRPRARCLCAPARAPASPRQVPRFSRSCPVTRQSSCLGDSSLPPPGSACPLASSFRSLSVPHPLRLSLQPPLRFPSSADLSLATPPWKHGAPGARLAPSGVEPTGGSTRRF